MIPYLVPLNFHFERYNNWKCCPMLFSILQRLTFCQTVESRSLETKLKSKNIEFWVFVDPIGRNQLHHTSILSNRWDLLKIICLWRITSTNVSILTPQYILCNCQFTSYKRFIRRVFHLAVSFQTLYMYAPHKFHIWAKIPSVTDASAPRFHQCSPNYKYQQL